MRLRILLLIAFMFVTAAGCAGGIQPAPTASSGVPLPVVEVSTAQGGGQAVELPSLTPSSGEAGSEIGVLPVDGITLSNIGMTFSMQVDESFLLNLGSDAYNWTVEVDHQDVLQRKIGVSVIRGAQGIYVAQTPGTATLTANGDPLCLQSRPACMMPSILFSVTLVVK